MIANGHAQQSSLERVRFFSRQLLGADDLASEQHYHRQRLRNHNRYLHGWGVVAGCEVQAAGTTANPWAVRVCPGYVVTPQGDEILIAAAVTFDLANCGVTSDDPCAYARPCPPITRRAQEIRRIHLAVRHIDCEAHPVRVAPVGCSCDDAQCEYSRIRDGYELCCLTELPDTHTEEPPGCAALFAADAVLPLPTASSNPWVVLATIDLPAVENEQVAVIDLVSTRRLLYPTWLLHEMVRCSAPQLTGTWHSVRADVYHDHPECTTGNNIELVNLRPGTGGKRRCQECAERAAGPARSSGRTEPGEPSVSPTRA